MQPRRQPDGRYRGSRRLPRFPRSRYAAVVMTAAVGAGIVALAAGAAIPEPAASLTGTNPIAQNLAVDDRLNALDRTNRSKERLGSAITVEQGAPDVWLLPIRIPYRITTRYEMRWGEFHPGVDLATPYGTPYYATHSGKVILAGWNGGFGNAIRIDNGGGVITIYGHSSRLLVTQGQHVEAGQLLGLVGSTGFSTGNHLHYEIHINDSPVNPFTFMRNRGVDIDKHAEVASGGIVVT